MTVQRRLLVAAALGVTLALVVATQGVAQHVETIARETDAESSAREALSRPVTITLDQVPLKKAIDALAAKAAVRVQYRAQLVDQKGAMVTLRAVDLPLGTAFEHALSGTGLGVVALARDFVTIVAIPSAETGDSRVSGIITGIVIDARTKQPLLGVTVRVDDATRGVTTGEDGRFRLANVAAGAHAVQLRRLGYARAIRNVTVADGDAVQLSVSLDASVNALDQVVVTGTVIATELKSVPNAITVISAKQIEQRGITRIDQLFRGDVPGVFAQNLGSSSALDQVTMFVRGATSFQSNGSTPATNRIKTYIDGIEMADPSYLSQIDPQSIERIEILTGPQASTIYGSNAINGVMQIFTKRNAAGRPRLTVLLTSGFVQNNFRSALTPQHDHSAQLSGAEGRIAYNAGGSWVYMGPWTPSKQMERTSGFGGTRFSAGLFTIDASARLGTTRNWRRGAANQTTIAGREAGTFTALISSNVTAPTQTTLAAQTMGLTLGFAPASWLSHEVVF
jgi:outer membrane receptor protein involved in Fe transport